MLNVAHAESAILVGHARFKTFLDKFTEQWQQPLMDAVVLRWWDTLEPTTKEQAKAQQPEMFAEIEKKVEALRDREDD